MTEKRIKSFEELHTVIQSFDKKIVSYRGQTELDWEVKPKVGRYKKFKTKNFLKEEKRILSLFKERAVPYINRPPENDWDWLAIAQHYGLPTRLLDWTRNPLVAAFFAVEEQSKSDSVIYVYHNNKYIKTEKKKPFSQTKIIRFIPNHITQRIIAQTGLFTIHPEPRKDFSDDPEISRIIIEKSFRKPLKKILFKYGIHESSLFPDLDGLTKHIEWLRTDVY